MSQVQTKYKDTEQSYGSGLLNLVVARGFLAKLLEHEAIQEFIGGAEPEILAHFQMIVNAATIEEEIAAQSEEGLADAAE
jgi:hypothetical protein